MSTNKQDKCYERIEAMVEQLVARRGEVAANGRLRLRQADMEESLPAGVPLHKRGFGMMDELP